MKRVPPSQPWTIREWGSLASCVGTLILVWMTFGPRAKQLGSGS